MNEKRILIADDSETSRKIIVRLLEEYGVTNFVEAKDGDEALALYQQGGISVALLDWNMPGKTGFEVLQAIREKDSQIPAVIITTDGDKGRVLQAIKAGVTEYLLKPLDDKALKTLQGICQSANGVASTSEA